MTSHSLAPSLLMNSKFMLYAYARSCLSSRKTYQRQRQLISRALAHLAFCRQEKTMRLGWLALRARISRCGLTMRSSRSRFVPQSTWQVQLAMRSEEHTSELQSLMRISYAVFCLKKKKNKEKQIDTT